MAETTSVMSELRREFPLLCDLAEQFDFAERPGGCTSALHAEADAALHELWMARSGEERE